LPAFFWFVKAAHLFNGIMLTKYIEAWKDNFFYLRFAKQENEAGILIQIPLKP